MSNNTATPFAQTCAGMVFPASTGLPSSAGFPMPRFEEPASSSAAGGRPQSAKPSDICAEHAVGFKAILDDAKREAHEENRKAAREGIRIESRKLSEGFSGRTLRMLLMLCNAFSDIAPFSDELSVFQPRVETRVVDVADAELDSRKWGARSDSYDLDEALSDLDETLDPRQWGSWAQPGSLGQSAGDRGVMANPTVIAARYEKEAEDARNEGWHHALNDLPISRYNEMIRASNDIALLWDGKAQATAYDLVKTLVFRMVLANDELGGPVLAAATGYLANIKRRAAPMIDLWHEDAGLEPPATNA